MGNPGARYATTRHNLGALVVTALADKHGEKFASRSKVKSRVVEFKIGEARCVAALPETFMNESGYAVRHLRNFYKVENDHVIVVHDELDLPFGRLRIKYGGGDNGHNGVISVHENLSTPDFIRVRMGIGRPTSQISPADYVLSNFSKEQTDQLPAVLESATEAIDEIVIDGLEAAQTRFNGAV